MRSSGEAGLGSETCANPIKHEPASRQISASATAKNNDTNVRKRRCQGCQARQQRCCADCPQSVVHLPRKQRERRGGRCAQKGVRRHGGGSDGPVGGDEICEYRRKAEEDPCAEWYRGNYWYDPVDVRICCKGEPVKTDGDEDRAYFSWEETCFWRWITVVFRCLFALVTTKHES